MYQWLSTSHEGYVMTDTPVFDITANPLSTTQQHTNCISLHTIRQDKTTQHNTIHNLLPIYRYTTPPYMISFHSQNALLSLGNPLQTLKRMSELIGLLCAQLDVLCRRNEESIGPATTVAVVSKAKQSTFFTSKIILILCIILSFIKLFSLNKLILVEIFSWFVVIGIL